MIGFKPPGRQYLHVVGIDLIRDADGSFLVLEDNGRTPSGVSYVLENRLVMKKVFPQLFQQCHVRRVEDYPQRLRDALRSRRAGRRRRRRRAWCCCRPGPYNSAYFEHSFLARHMGVELVLGQDLFVARRQGLPEDDPRAAAGGRDLSPRRRRFPRPGGVPARQPARRARPVRRLSRPATSPWPTPSAPASPTTRRSTRSSRT